MAGSAGARLIHAATALAHITLAHITLAHIIARRRSRTASRREVLALLGRLEALLIQSVDGSILRRISPAGMHCVMRRHSLVRALPLAGG